MITNQLPALQLLLPFTIALISALTFNAFVSRILCLIGIFVSLIINIYGLMHISEIKPYYFGNWKAPIGIEFQLSYLNQSIITYINSVLFFLLFFSNNLLKLTVLNFITKNRQNLFYTILLFAHAGYIGILSTNDIFNLYVFIEISSLSAYTLMSLGENKKASIGAFNYLIMGSLGATLILISIGIFLSITGSLNISDTQIRLQGNYNSPLVLTAAAFFIIGAILKVAFFPMHFWMIKAYRNAPSIVLSYIASISGIIGIYIIFKFLYCCFDNLIIAKQLYIFFRPLSIGCIILCSWHAYRSNNLKELIIYSGGAQIGYVFLIFAVSIKSEIIWQLLLADGINKVAMFLIISYLEINSSLECTKLSKIKINNFYFKILIGLNLISLAGLPISYTFIAKINMLNFLIKENMIIDFIIVLICSTISLFYNFKIIASLFFSSGKDSKILFVEKFYGLIAISIIQLILIIFHANLAVGGNGF